MGRLRLGRITYHIAWVLSNTLKNHNDIKQQSAKASKQGILGNKNFGSLLWL